MLVSTSKLLGTQTAIYPAVSMTQWGSVKESILPFTHLIYSEVESRDVCSGGEDYSLFYRIEKGYLAKH